MSLKNITTKIIQANCLYLLIAIAQFIFVVNVNAQSDIKDLRVIGNYVQFSYNTLDQFNNGITLSGWTRVTAKFRYDGSSGWEIRMWTLSNEIEYEGESEHNIQLSELEITPISINSTDASATVNVTFALAEGHYDPMLTNQVIAEGDGGTVGAAPPVEIELTITYKLGSMINKPDGLYFVNLVLLLVEK